MPRGQDVEQLRVRPDAGPSSKVRATRPDEHGRSAASAAPDGSTSTSAAATVARTSSRVRGEAPCRSPPPTSVPPPTPGDRVTFADGPRRQTGRTAEGPRETDVDGTQKRIDIGGPNRTPASRPAWPGWTGCAPCWTPTPASPRTGATGPGSSSSSGSSPRATPPSMPGTPHCTPRPSTTSPRRSRASWPGPGSRRRTPARLCRADPRHRRRPGPREGRGCVGAPARAPGRPVGPGPRAGRVRRRHRYEHPTPRRARCPPRPHRSTRSTHSVTG